MTAETPLTTASTRAPYHKSARSAEFQAAYRRDIDGLRGISILAVLAFHYFPDLVPGGFVGVDVFFVISGFLISGIVFRSLQAGVFSYLKFYSRRIKRIFPSLIVVLTSSLALGWLFLFPTGWKSLGKHVFAGSTFLSNIALMREGGYFDSAAKPLLHLWSLGIEEQFYITWPLLLGVLFMKKRSALLHFILIILLVSFGVNLWFVSRQPHVAFYFPAARFWELAMGATLSYVTTFPSETPLSFLANRSVAFILSVSGLMLLVLSTIAITEHKHIPGAWMLLPTLASLFLIAAGPAGWCNRVILSSSPLVSLGLISYPLYLWHWPLLVFARLLFPSGIDWSGYLGLAAVSVLLSILTYRYIEAPIRWHRSAITVPCILTGALGVLALIGLSAQYAVPPRIHGTGHMIEDAVTDWEYPFGQNYGKTSNFTVGLIAGNPDERVLYIGDSHLEQYYTRIKLLTSAQPRRFPTTVFATYGLCPPLPGVRDRLGFPCDAFFTYAMEQARDPRVKVIVLGAFWENYFGYETAGNTLSKLYRTDDGLLNRPGLEMADESLGKLAAVLTTFHRQGKRLYIVFSNPTSALYDPKRMVSRFSGALITRNLDRSSLAFSQPIRERLYSVAAESGATVIDPAAYLCGAIVCQTMVDGRPIYKDDNHLRASYVRQHARFMDQIYDKWTN
jgi:peptidoglycan/LPS O-acetylase OafA/YrhL